MRLPKISYPSPYQMKRNIVIARKIPQHAAKAIAHEISEKEHAVKRLLPGIMLVAETFTQNPQTVGLATKINDPVISKTNILIARNHIKKLNPLSFNAANVKPHNKFTKKSQSLTAKYEGTAQELDVLISRLLEKTGGDKTKNPLYGKGKSFIESGEKHHVNPSVLVAIAMHESGRGTSSMARNRNNIGGLIGKNGALRFNKVEDCIESMAKTIEKHTKNDILTIEQLGRSGKYCAKSVGDSWADDVVFYINKL